MRLLVVLFALSVVLHLSAALPKPETSQAEAKSSGAMSSAMASPKGSQDQAKAKEAQKDKERLAEPVVMVDLTSEPQPEAEVEPVAEVEPKPEPKIFVISE